MDRESDIVIGIKNKYWFYRVNRISNKKILDRSINRNSIYKSNGVSFLVVWKIVGDDRMFSLLCFITKKN